MPRYFAKTGHVDQNPNKVKKDGHGKGNWGKEGDEIVDIDEEFHFMHSRRRSNSTSLPLETKFDQNEDYDEEVFEEEEGEEDQQSN